MRRLRFNKKQDDLLEIRAHERVRELEAARLDQLSELYRLAELGRLSTALFHDLANYLTNIALDIEGLKDSDQSGAVRRIHGNVRHIDGVVRRVRRQIQGDDRHEIFNVMYEIDEVVGILSSDAGRAGVTVSVDPGNVRPSLMYKGDLTRFRRILLNVISNAIESYEGRRGLKRKPVVIRLKRTGRRLTIGITDKGKPIPAARMDKIFEPFYTTKPGGIGLGLFIVRQVVENHFGGTVDASSTKTGTTFAISLPKSHYPRPHSGKPGR